MRRTVWKDEAARERLEGWFGKFRDRIPGAVESREVSTRFGSSHLLVAGPVDAPPLVCVHGMRISSAHVLSELRGLVDRFRIYSPDVPGQSVRGPQLKLPLHDDSHARWLLDVLDALALPTAKVFGVSWGGFIARQTASVAPERVGRLALLVPAGIVNGSHWRGLTRMALPLLRYRIWPTEANLKRFLDPLLTTWDPDWARYMAETLRDMPFDFRIPPLASDAELKRLTMPLLAIAADEDVSFPGRPLIERVQRLAPHAETELVVGSKHCPPTTPEFRAWLANRLADFFAG